MRLNQSRYKLECTCGYTERRTVGDVDEHGLITFRLRCPRCNKVSHWLKKSGRTRVHDSTVELQFAIHKVFEEIAPPLTVRQTYYLLTARKVVDKTEAGYNKVQRELTKMRRSGSIPYEWIADNSRTFYHVNAHQSLAEAAQDMARWYRRDLWAAQGVHVEIWLEKRALVGQLYPICNEFGVRLYPCGGYSSISFAFEAAMELRQISDPIYIYHLSDFDADGVFSSVSLENELRMHGAEFTFRRLALAQGQIGELGLHDALRPQKRSSTRWGFWVDHYGAAQDACELDAIHPATLRTMVRDTIESHIDPYAWARLQAVEREERRSIEQWAAALGSGKAAA